MTNTTTRPADTEGESGVELIRRIKCEKEEHKDRLAEIRKTFTLFHAQGLVEIRALKVPGKGRPYTASGYFDDHDRAAEAALRYDELGAQVYMVLNPLAPALLARAANRMKDHADQTTTDAEITARRWLMYDLDPIRPTGVASTEAELTKATELAAEIEDFLRSKGWPLPVIVRSGNGYQLFYRIELPNDAASTELIKTVLVATSEALKRDPAGHGEPSAAIDLKVFNAARLFRVFGTMNRKGDPTADRPHRRSEIVSVPEELAVVPRELLEAVAALAPPTTRPKATYSQNGHAASQNGRGASRSSVPMLRLDVAGWLTDRNVAFDTKELTGGIAYRIACPFDSNHGSNHESAFFQRSDGLLTFECKHASCNGRTWHEARNVLGVPAANRWGIQPAIGHEADSTDDQHRERSPAPADPPHFANMMTCRQLLDADLRPRFRIRNVLVAGQPCIVGARAKGMKTSVACDLGVSLGSGTPFLGMFVADRCRVGFWSGESGAAVLRETARRIAEARQVDLADCSILWSFCLPKLCREAHLDALATVIQKESLDVAIIDPLYLSLLDPQSQGRPGDLFYMGSLLSPLTEIAQSTGVTFVILHHFRKSGIADDAEPAGLEELTQSGVSEWCRQWILLQRRSPFQGDGRHELWMRTGGSSGHAGLWAVTIDEGILDLDTFEGRRWDVQVEPVADARASAQAERVNRKAAELEKRQGEHRDKLLKAIRQYPEGETARALRILAGLNPDNFGRAAHTLLTEGRIEACLVTKGKGNFDGFKPKN
ncbi:MAG: AAA family ATPase [Pirellulales bacterium]